MWPFKRQTPTVEQLTEVLRVLREAEVTSCEFQGLRVEFDPSTYARRRVEAPDQDVPALAASIDGGGGASSPLQNERLRTQLGLQPRKRAEA